MSATMKSMISFSFLLLLGYLSSAMAIPYFFRGRPKGGMLGAPAMRENVKLPAPMWFTQRLDHFNDADTRTFQQRYFVNNTFHKDTGPVFLMLGGEGPANPIWMVEAQWVTYYAAMYGAACVLLEHRYYGDSHPTADMSTDNLQYLSSEQALADAAYFQAYYTKEASLTYGPKWIVFGGSYSGSLAAWSRLKYPHLFHGAVATSAPLLAVLDFDEYLDVVVNSIATMSTQGPSCNMAIQKANEIIEPLANTTAGKQQLKSLFMLCDELEDENDNANLFSTLAGNFEGVVQYNRDNRAFEGAVGTNITIMTLCDIMSDPSIPKLEDRYAAVNSLMLKTYGQSCLDIKYSKMIDEMKQTAWNSSAGEGGRQWTYQTCTEFGFFQSSDTTHPQPFAKRFPASFFTQQCTDIYGSKFTADFLKSGIQATNINYGGLDLRIANVVYPNGAVDPWHSLGFIEGNQAIYINGTAHCANMYPTSPNDLPQLTMARQTIAKMIGTWLQN